MKKYDELQSEAIALTVQIARTGSDPKYSWRKAKSKRPAAIGWHAGYEIGEVMLINDAYDKSRRWLWSVKGSLHWKHRDDLMCVGWSSNAIEAAAAVEATYDLLTTLNLELAVNS